MYVKMEGLAGDSSANIPLHYNCTLNGTNRRQRLLVEGCVHIGDPWPVACHRDQCWILSCVSSINDLDEYPI